MNKTYYVASSYLKRISDFRKELYVVPEFVSTVQTAFGDFGAFFKPIITPMLTNYVALSDSAGVSFFCWLVGYYITLLFVYIVFSLFTFLITMFLDKIDSMKGGRR